MVSISAFLIKSIACAGLLYLYYLLFLKNRKMHQFNRFYLLGTVVLSIIIPFFHFEWQGATASSDGMAYKLLRIVDTGIVEQEIVYQPTGLLSLSTMVFFLYAIVSLVLVSLFVYRLVWLHKIRKTGKVSYAGNIRVVHTTTGHAPFSYMNDLYWRVDMPADDDTGRKIWKHELVHIRQKHSTDKLFLQFIIILFWINPIYWLIQRECALVHEFIADNEVNKDGDTEQLARMLLQTIFTGKNSFMLNTFFHSPIKRRIMMFQKTDKTNLRALRQLLVLPVVAGSILLFSFSAGTKTHRAAKRITIVVDAGHGGTDKGAKGINGIYEKDINLSIVNEIITMADDYNIEVIAARPTDEYVTLLQRAAIPGETNADLLVSIHLNNDVEGSGYQVILDDRNNPDDKSRALASAINAQMLGTGIVPEIYNKHLAVLQHANVPAIMIECGDITNQEDVARLTSKASLRQFCANILNGVVAYAAK